MFVRLAFAIATHIDPDILIIDEALSIGDGVFARRSFDRIMDFKRAGKTIFFCSHSLYQVEALCDRALWVDAGIIKLAGAPATVVTEYAEFLRMEAAQKESLEQDEVGAAQERETRLIAGEVPTILDVIVKVDGHQARAHKVASGASTVE